MARRMPAEVFASDTASGGRARRGSGGPAPRPRLRPGPALSRPSGARPPSALRARRAVSVGHLPLEALGLARGHHHLAHRREALGAEEHVLGPAEPDALGAEGARACLASSGVSALVRTLSARTSSPQRRSSSISSLISGSRSFGRPEEHLARAAIDRDHVPSLDGDALSRDGEASRHRRRSPALHTRTTTVFPIPRPTTAACDVLPAGGGEDAFGGLHPEDVVGIGLRAHQDDLPPFFASSAASAAVNTDRAHRRAGRGADPLGDRLRLALGSTIGCRHWSM